MAYTRVNWQDLPSTTTPRNATNLNKMDIGIKTNDDKLEGNAPMGNVVVDSIRSKNMFDNKSAVIVNYAGKVDILETGIRLYTSSSVNNQFACFKLTNELLGKTITISSTITPSSTNSGAIRIFYGTNSNPATQSANVELNTTGSVTATLLSSMPSGCDSIFILLYANRTGTTQANDYVSYTNLQIEEGSTATTYSPYQELDNQENYLTSEIKIGTWIDGKPLYRKVYTGTTSSGDGFVSLDTNINAFFLKNATFPSLSYRDFTYYLDTSNNRAGLDIAITNTTTGLMQFRVLNTTLRNQSYIFIIEYTKTTD